MRLTWGLSRLAAVGLGVVVLTSAGAARADDEDQQLSSIMDRCNNAAALSLEQIKSCMQSLRAIMASYPAPGASALMELLNEQIQQITQTEDGATAPSSGGGSDDSSSDSSSDTSSSDSSDTDQTPTTPTCQEGDSDDPNAPEMCPAPN
ncbi:MAG TPA: hypothetical protein VGL58_17660 [Caulobacteraceae bacterium]|jgi:hypothetical protein